MTTAEFAKANLAALEEPVSIRRYTKTIGTYYPGGVVPPVAMIDMGPNPTPDQVEALRLQLDAISTIGPATTNAAAKIVDLEDEIKRLKRELAARPPKSMQPSGATIALLSRSTDPFAGLAKQDREFFERRLGKKK